MKCLNDQTKLVEQPPENLGGCPDCGQRKHTHLELFDKLKWKSSQYQKVKPDTHDPAYGMNRYVRLLKCVEF